MSKRVTQSYAPEFRAEAIKLVLEQGFPVVEAAAQLNLNQGTLAYWVTQARKADKTSPAKVGTPSTSDLMAEVRQLRKELAEARMEHDIQRKRRRSVGIYYKRHIISICFVMIKVAGPLLALSPASVCLSLITMGTL